MSVRVPDRSSGELEVNTKARELTVHTFKVLSNKKWFPEEQEAFISKMQDCVLEIQSLCWEANNIRVDNIERKYEHRLTLQENAISKCDYMHMLIETAKPLFHLDSRRVVFWVKLTKELKSMISAWNSKDVKRLKPED